MGGKFLYHDNQGSPISVIHQNISAIEFSFEAFRICNVLLFCIKLVLQELTDTKKNGNIWKITYRFTILGYAYIKFIFNDIHVIYYLQITLCFSLYKHCHVTLANG